MQEQLKEVTEETPEFTINSKPGVDDKVRHQTRGPATPNNAKVDIDVRLFIGEHFSTPKGKLVRRMLENAYYHRISYDRDSARQTDFNEGQRDVVAFIINCVAYAAVKNNKEAMTNG